MGYLPPVGEDHGKLDRNPENCPESRGPFL